LAQLIEVVALKHFCRDRHLQSTSHSSGVSTRGTRAPRGASPAQLNLSIVRHVQLAMEVFRLASMASRATAARFNAWTDRHRTALLRFWHLISFAVLFAIPAHAGYRAPLAQAAQASCGSICLAVPSFYVIAAAAWGGTAIVVAMVYARLLQALRPYPQRKWGLEVFGWGILALAVSSFDAVVGPHCYGHDQIELFVGFYLGGYGINAPSGVVDFFWSKFTRERTSP
jgi:hypothetical protein